MKVINKSGTANTGLDNEVFYVQLDLDTGDCWTGDEFACARTYKTNSEEEATEEASVGQVIARVELVAKIV